MINISKKLKTLRTEHGYTIQALSDSIGIAVRTYQNYEYGQREISTEVLYKIADFYGVTTDYLLGRDNGEPESINCLPDKANMTALEKKILDNYMTLPESTRKELMEFLHKSVKEVQSESDN